MARLLALTSRVPWPPHEGHQLRSYHLLDALASHHAVHLLSCLRHDDQPEASSPLHAKLAGFETFAIPADRSHVATGAALARGALTRTPFVVAKYAIPSLRKRVAELAAACDLIHLDMLPLMTNIADVAARVPIVLNAHNVEHALLCARIGVEQRAATRMFLRNQAPKLRTFERTTCARASAILACSEDDAAQLRRLAPATPIHVVPNGVDLEYNRPAKAAPVSPARMVFVGQMGWFPNRDGIAWFLAEIFPRILKRRADARFVLVGKHDGLTLPDSLRSHVELAGFVADVRRPVLDAAIYVVPLRVGSGTRLKVLEAMALGKAIVTTRVGAEGIDLAHAREALFADDADHFADAVLRLCDEPDTAARLGAAARQAAERTYGWSAIGQGMLPIYAGLLD